MRPLAELQAIAERAIGHAEDEAQATVVHHRAETTIELTCVIDGRAAAVRAAGTSEDELRRAARAAALHARRPRAWPSAGLPDPVTDVPPAETSHSIQFAVASTKGVRAAWTRAPRRSPPKVELDPRRAEPVPLPSEALPLVLGPEALATLLDHLRPAFGVELDLASGPLHGRIGTEVASPLVSVRAPAGGFDAEGLPHRAVTLIENGVARARVHDTASAARANAQSTGHATRAAALAPLPEDLAVAPGEAESLEALCRPIGRGLYIGALSPERAADGDAFRHTTRGAVLIEDGVPAVAVRDGAVMIEPLAVLASVEALTRATYATPLSQDGMAVLPALRAGTGCRPS